MSQETKEKKSRQLRVLAFAMLIVIVLLVAFTRAWLFESKGLQTMTKVQFAHLELHDGQTQDSSPVELGEIDVRKAGEKRVPFYVDISKGDSFILQLGHTTNLPLSYKIVEVKDDDVWSEWQNMDITDDMVVSGKYLNLDNSVNIANGIKHETTYGNYTNDNVQKNAEPLYWQSDSITFTKKERKYILIVSWTKCDDTVTDKDTEMIYLTAGIPNLGGSDETK